MEIYSKNLIYDSTLHYHPRAYSENVLQTVTIIKDINQEIGPFINRAISHAEELLTASISELMSEVENDIITTFFQFPPEIKTAAKQYLIYFAQFLLDIGIEADTEIREELHETLFKIIPKDKGESLERIKEALGMFLNMPGMQTIDAEIAKSGDIAAMQLQANIHHLKGQMMLMQASVQMKDATIESLQLTNYQLKELVEKKDAENKKSEDIIPGVVSVSKFEKGELSISWAEILRRLKRRF